MNTLNKYKKLAKNPIIRGTFILTTAGILTRIIGFFFRIFLSRCIGAEGIGIYQLIFPIQILCYSLCTSGIETAISRLVAGTKNNDKTAAIRILKCGLILSLFISIITNVVVYSNASFIANRFILESRCTDLIKYMSFSIPLASIHACVCGYYLGLKKTLVPAWSQFIEQLFRVISIYLIIIVYKQNHITVTPLIAVIGSLIGELASVIYSIFCITGFERKNKKEPKKNTTKCKTLSNFKNIFTLSLPLTLNRVMLSVLSSIQNILIPNRLIFFGMSSSAALSVYGITSGLVLPLIMFPGALINSIALLLLPTIAEAEFANNKNKINVTSSRTLMFSCIFGIYCTGIFVKYGKIFGIALFSNPEAGKYITILGFLCPFFYIISTLASIINGLGKTGITFLHSIVSTLIQIAFTVFAIPKIGIIGFLLGLLVSCIISSISHFISAKKYIDFKLNSMQFIIIPILTIFISSKLVTVLFKIFPFCPIYAQVIAGAIIITFSYFYINYRSFVTQKQKF